MSDLVVLFFLATGFFFMLVAAVGFVRFPDVFCRLHVTCVLDTLGAPLILLAVGAHVGLSLTLGKILMAVAFLLMTSSLVSHLLARTALDAGYRPCRTTRTDLQPIAKSGRDVGAVNQ
jgi:multicomponent Na+:H+ antiporter subunit G